MSTPPYTVTKLVRWRVKDWVSCFYACKFPLDQEESETNSPSTTTLVPREPAAVIPKVETNQKPKKEKELSSPSSSKSLAKKKEIGESSSRWPSFADDDYIVFCFRDDGEVHVLQDKKSEASGRVGTSSSIASSSKRVNLQLIKLEDEAATNDKDSNGKGNAKEPAHIKTGIRFDEIKEISETGEEDESGEGKEISAASSDSNQSDAASTSSFAFPIIQEEWIGSPVQMPRTEGPKSKNMRIHCCRF